jgi:hypothetical protein
MSDPVPYNRNKLGYIISMITHPLVVFIPTLVIVLRHADPLEAGAWLALIALVILIPAVVLLRRVRRQGRHTYQRDTRHLIYLTFWLSMLACAVLAVLLDAPQRLVFSLVSLCVWVPLQGVINARITKLSIHVAVISGIALALILMGELDTPLRVEAVVVVVAATAWARIVTGHHTPAQVGLGVIVSSASVLAAFALLSI